MPRGHVVECLDYWVADAGFRPAALDRAVLYLLDVSVALLGRVVAGIDHHDTPRCSVYDSRRQLRHALLGYREDHDVGTLRGLADRHRYRAGLGSQVGQALGAPRIGNRDVVPEGREPARQDASDAAGADDCDLHDVLLLRVSWRALEPGDSIQQLRVLDPQASGVPSSRSCLLRHCRQDDAQLAEAINRRGLAGTSAGG